MAFTWNAANSHPNTVITGEQASITSTAAFSSVFGSTPGEERNAFTDPLDVQNKVYFEVEVLSPVNSIQAFGIGDPANDSTNTALAGRNPDFGFAYYDNGENNSFYYKDRMIDNTSNAPGITTGDVVMFAFDTTTGDIWTGVNGTWNTGDPATTTAPIHTLDLVGTPNSAFFIFSSAGRTTEVIGRWDDASVQYAIPTGFKTPNFVSSDTTGAIDLPVSLDVFNPTGQPAFPVEISVSQTGQLSLPVSVNVQHTGTLTLPVAVEVPESRAISRRFTISVQNTGQIALPISVEVQNPTGRLAIPIEITSTQTGQIGVGVSVSVFDSSQPHRCQWSARVLLDNVDVSARMTEQISVSASEGAARVATFTLKPFAGVVDPNRWVGKKVVIDYLDADQVQRRLFSGFVDTPRYNATDRLTTFECSDLLQNSLEGSEREQIDRLVGGFWSDLVFDADADGWRYAQDRLSTIPASLDLDRFGAARVTAWQSKASPDFSFASERVVNGSLGVSLVSRRDLLNRVQLVADYRYSRNWQAEKRFSWYFDNTLCQQLRDEGKTTPNRPMIQAAIDSSGWIPKSIDYTPPPSSRDVRCPGSATVSFWSISDELRDFMVWGVRYVIARRWAQSLTESYAVTVEAPESIEAVGEISKEQRTGFQSENSGDWDKWETYEESNGEPVSTGVTYSNQDERQSANTALLALIGRTRSDILKSHRANSVSFQTLIQPEMERTHTAKIETETVTAQGKVSGITHILDFATGSALTDVQLAVSRKLGDQTAQDSGTVAPAAPADEFGDSGKYSTQLGSQYGGRFSSGEQQEIEGYTGNYQPPDSGAPLFDVNWAFTAPAIDESFTDSKTLESPSVNRIAIPDDLLEMVA